MADRVSFLVLKFWESFLRMQLKEEKISREGSILSWEKQGNFVCFLGNARETTHLSSIWISIDGSDSFFIRDFIGSCLIQRQIERESCFLSVYVGRITGSLTPAGLSSINLAQSSAPRCVKYDYSAPKMSQLVEPSPSSFTNRPRISSNHSDLIGFQRNLLHVVLLF